MRKWIEATIRLPVALFAGRGPLRLGPYLIEIADAIGDARSRSPECGSPRQEADPLWGSQAMADG
jgi:hypothetical protein